MSRIQGFLLAIGCVWATFSPSIATAKEGLSQSKIVIPLAIAGCYLMGGTAEFIYEDVSINVPDVGSYNGRMIVAVFCRMPIEVPTMPT